MNKIYIDHDSTVTNLGGREYNDSWSRDSTSTHHTVKGITTTNTYKSIDVNFEVEPNKDYYLLYYIYSTGDSFGTDEDGEIEFIELYRDKGMAEIAAKLIAAKKDTYKNVNWESKMYVTILLDNGKEYKHYCHFLGYFERLSGVYVKKVTLRNISTEDDLINYEY